MALDFSELDEIFNDLNAVVFREKVVDFNFSDNFTVLSDVLGTRTLPKMTLEGEPRPYRDDDDSAGNNAKFKHRVLTLTDGKWDFKFDPMDFRKSYLQATNAINGVDPDELPLSEFIYTYIQEKFYDHLRKKTVLNGIHDANGTGAADLADGINKIIADAITDGDVIPYATGTITLANAFDKINAMATTVHDDLELTTGAVIYCSNKIFKWYVKGYNANNQYKANVTAKTELELDNCNVTLKVATWIPGTSQRLIMTYEGNLTYGTNMEKIGIYPFKKFNVQYVRFIMPNGFQIQDVEEEWFTVNDQV